MSDKCSQTVINVMTVNNVIRSTRDCIGLLHCMEVKGLLKRNGGYVSVGLCCMHVSGAAKQHTVPGNQDPDWM